ncbi:hypothetical protein B0H13DRAFT_1897490 [Mycena leptocephala]|nr:hypothetical protein B0H13DRAFT_1897490 [Mycena leptocephala]
MSVCCKLQLLCTHCAVHALPTSTARFKSILLTAHHFSIPSTVLYSNFYSPLKYTCLNELPRTFATGSLLIWNLQLEIHAVLAFQGFYPYDCDTETHLYLPTTPDDLPASEEFPHVRQHPASPRQSILPMFPSRFGSMLSFRLHQDLRKLVGVCRSGTFYGPFSSSIVVIENPKDIDYHTWIPIAQRLHRSSIRLKCLTASSHVLSVRSWTFGGTLETAKLCLAYPNFANIRVVHIMYTEVLKILRRNGTPAAKILLVSLSGDTLDQLVTSPSNYRIWLQAFKGLHTVAQMFVFGRPVSDVEFSGRIQMQLMGVLSQSVISRSQASIPLRRLSLEIPVTAATEISAISAEHFPDLREFSLIMFAAQPPHLSPAQTYNINPDTEIAPDFSDNLELDPETSEELPFRHIPSPLDRHKYNDDAVPDHLGTDFIDAVALVIRDSGPAPESGVLELAWTMPRFTAQIKAVSHPLL